MRAYSAPQAVSPAIDRTRRYLFHPFEMTTYLKLATVACVSEGFAANFSFATGHRLATEASDYGFFHPSDEKIAILVLVILAGLICGVIAFYLVACFRFAFFHCLVHQTKEIRPAWNRYRFQAIRFFNSGLIVWIIFAIISTAIVFPFAFNLYKLFHSSRMGVHYGFQSLFLLFVPLFVIVPIIALIAFVVDVVLHDFILPHMALENASFGAAWRAARTHIAAQKGSFVLYCFLRAALPVVALIALLIVVGIPLVIIFGVLATSASGFLDLLEDTTPLGAVFHVIFQILFGVLALGVGVLVEFGLGGPIATWVRNYALLYYGGRYKALGDVLSPPA
ncbi:MAG: hypothetical protein ABR976_14005 [Terracidiphilus sp.]|jgi:hypothetical protein